MNHSYLIKRNASLTGCYGGADGTAVTVLEWGPDRESLCPSLELKVLGLRNKASALKLVPGTTFTFRINAEGEEEKSPIPDSGFHMQTPVDR